MKRKVRPPPPSLCRYYGKRLRKEAGGIWLHQSNDEYLICGELALPLPSGCLRVTEEQKL